MLAQIEWDIYVLITSIVIFGLLVAFGWMYAKYITLRSEKEFKADLKDAPACSDFCANYNVGCEAEMFHSRFECDYYEPRKVERRKVYDTRSGEVVPVERKFNPDTAEITRGR